MRTELLGSTVNLYFDTYGTGGDSIAPSSLTTANIQIYKNGSTERGSVVGYLVTANAGSKNGSHIISIDTSDDTIAGFFEDDAEYSVRIIDLTVDGVTPIHTWIRDGKFRLSAKPNVDDLNDLSSANVTAAVPTVNEILAGLNAGTYDGKTFTELMAVLRGLGFGNIEVTDNGDSTYTVVLYAADATTPIATFTTSQTNGARTIV